ncbi:hypothetical protein Daesc_001582 [Daldinia eschscholtzii]|uniref:Uncharacterized protein n=1 Tax=Daldinia eschscholtzii TaxID=292717 RepID=A0AAX6MV79_9PEZI
MDSGMPTPPVEDNIKPSTSSRRSTTYSSNKVVKPIHRGGKRAASHSSHSPTHDHPPPLSPHAIDNRHKRVWKACERCRMKKTKEARYAEVLENTQFALIATVHKLYAMVRNGQSWDLGEPELNDRGQPVIHNIATKLGCIRPNADADLPPHSVFPEDEAGLAKLAAELDVQQREREKETHATEHRSETESNCTRTDRASSSELDHSDFEQDYRKAILGNQNLQTMSPQSFTSYDVDMKTMQSDVDSTSLFAVQSPTVPTSYPTWNMSRPSSMDLTPQYMQGMDMDMAEMMLSQGLVESEFGTIKPHMIQCPNPEVMLGVGDPMIYSGYNMESLRS